MFVWNSRNSITSQLADFLSRYHQPKLTKKGRSVLIPWLFGPLKKAQNNIISCPKLICSFQPIIFPNLPNSFFLNPPFFYFQKRLKLFI